MMQVIDPDFDSGLILLGEAESELARLRKDRDFWREHWKLCDRRDAAMAIELTALQERHAAVLKALTNCCAALRPYSLADHIIGTKNALESACAALASEKEAHAA